MQQFRILSVPADFVWLSSTAVRAVTQAETLRRGWFCIQWLLWLGTIIFGMVRYDSRRTSSGMVCETGAGGGVVRGYGHAVCSAGCQQRASRW